MSILITMNQQSDVLKQQKAKLLPPTLSISIWRKQRLPLAIFLVLCMNLVVAPVVYAAASGKLERGQAWALGILGFVTLGLVVYLFIVVFQPERF